MKKQLIVEIGQASTRGVKTINQDSIGAIVPKEPTLSAKGVIAAIADGISTSDVSQIASETAINSVLSDYYSTSDSWSVKSSAQKVIKAVNYWLYSQTQNSELRFNFNKGYVCTFSAIVIKSHTAHIFHCGDSRIYRLEGTALEPLTTDHRHIVDSETSYLSRGLGIQPTLDIDYRSFAVNEQDHFLLTTDGIYEFLTDKQIATIISAKNQSLESRANQLVQKALESGSDDNLSVQIVKVSQLPDREVSEIRQSAQILPHPPLLHPKDQFDGYEIIREIYISSRSHVFLVKECDTQHLYVLKTPSSETRSDKSHLESFLMEEWILNRVNNVHLLRSNKSQRQKKYLYSVAEYIDGVSLAQWMRDNPTPDLNTVRGIIEQISKGLQAMHRQEMVHQDLRPNNVMIDPAGTVKIIDFGATKVAGISESMPMNEQIPGTAQYAAPEYFVGHEGTHQSDIYSLAVIVYQMLTRKLPYGTHVSKATTVKAQQSLEYVSVCSLNPSVPNWVDYALKKALHIDPSKRYTEVAEFMHDLKTPNPKVENMNWVPMMERNPILFWQRLSLLLFVLLIISLFA